MTIAFFSVPSFYGERIPPSHANADVLRHAARRARWPWKQEHRNPESDPAIAGTSTSPKLEAQVTEMLSRRTARLDDWGFW